ncbi:MAG TPA: sodium:solute symporter family protein [Candidatus Saccharimonadales bacterium]|nr:sodium:solute symporter family protein [Candidatus Saccharimonadales bacterium]
MLNLYAVVLTVIVGALLTVSIWQMRKVKTKADYLVAGRSLPAYVLVFTLLSSWIGAGSLFAGAENAFRNGFAALWQPAGGWAGLLIIYFVAPRARKFAQFTIPDLLEARYNTAARVLGTIAILFAYTAITSYQFRAGGDIMHLIFPAIAKTQGTLIIAAFVIVFTALAGMASVAYMDVVIGILISVIGFIALPVLMGHIGGSAGLHASLPATHFTLFGEWGKTPGMAAGARDNKEALIRALEYFFPTFLLMIGNQSMYQKFFSAKTEKDASVAVVGWVFGTVVLETLIVTLAVVGSGLFALSRVPAPDFAPREIIPFTARHFLAPLVGALLMGSVFAKVISTANNYLFSPATNLINDVYTRFIRPDASQKNVLLVSRFLVVGLGLWALVQAIKLESVLAKAMYAYTIYSAAITPVVMAAFFWRRATREGAVACLLSGTVITVAWDSVKTHLPRVIGERDAIFPALIVSVVALVAVSLMTPRPSKEQIAQFYE